MRAHPALVSAPIRFRPCRDLLQDIHLAVAQFRRRNGARTWVYRVAASGVALRRRPAVSLDELGELTPWDIERLANGMLQPWDWALSRPRSR